MCDIDCLNPCLKDWPVENQSYAFLHKIAFFSFFVWTLRLLGMYIFEQKQMSIPITIYLHACPFYSSPTSDYGFLQVLRVRQHKVPVEAGLAGVSYPEPLPGQHQGRVPGIFGRFNQHDHGIVFKHQCDQMRL
jgi:hypothetical protein